MKKMKFTVLLLCGALLLGSCGTMNNKAKGGIIGGGSGAAAGAIIGGLIGKGKGQPLSCGRCCSRYGSRRCHRTQDGQEGCRSCQD